MSQSTSNFAKTLAPLDDDALAALANKGLVRRARKDLEKDKPNVTGGDDASVTLGLEGQTVRLVQPIGKSTCTCASGVCRHILACIIHLKEPAPPVAAGETGSTDSASTAPAPEPVPTHADEAELLAIDEAALTKWAGKPLMKRAAVTLSRGYEVEQGPAVVVRLPAMNVTVRWVGGGLDGLLCACHAPGPCEHKVAAVLAYRAHKTGESPVVPQATLEASAGAPRTRDEVRASVSTLLREMVTLGLSRASVATEQRLRTLATSAHGVDLPRLERMLKTLADEVRLLLRRDAAASSAAILATAARVDAVCAALARPTPAVVGEHRSVYMPVSGAIDLVGLGARRWRTRSGYHGLTVFFWEPAGRTWTGWTDARPVDTPGFDPVSRFDQDGPWLGAGSPRQAAQTRWRVTGAHRNGVGRIAAREKTRGIAGGRATPDDGPVVRDFAEVSAVMERAFAVGLADRRDHAELMLLAPAVWGDAVYDPVLQEVTRPIADGAGRVLPLVLRHSPETQHALTTLQQADASTLRAVLGSLRLGARGLYVEPITLWTDAKPIHLTLDDVPRKPTARVTQQPCGEEAEDVAEAADEGEESGETHSALGQLLGRMEAELLAVAEGGVGVVRDLRGLRHGARELSDAGLTTVGAALEGTVAALEQLRKSTSGATTEPAGRLSHAVYVLRLAQECRTVAQASVA